MPSGHCSVLTKALLRLNSIWLAYQIRPPPYQSDYRRRLRLSPMESCGGSVDEPMLQCSDVTSLSSERSHKTSGKLESILTDHQLPFCQRLPTATWTELNLLSTLAAPAVAVYMINYLMSMSTQIFAGHLGNLELAAASLGNTGIQLLAYGLMVLNMALFHFCFCFLNCY